MAATKPWGDRDNDGWSSKQDHFSICSPSLPLALIITVFGIAVLIAQVAPSRVTSGVYQVSVGEGPAQFRLATESLTCSRTGNAATCTAPVAGRQLTVDITYRNPATVWDSTCTAQHGDRPVPCTTQVDHGHASASVEISDSLGPPTGDSLAITDSSRHRNPRADTPRRQ